MVISKRTLTKLRPLLLAAVVTLCVPLNTSSQTEQLTITGVLVDNSGSLRSQFDRVLELGNGVIEHTHKQGPVSIFSFKSPGKPESAPPLIVAHTIWNQDKTVLTQYLNHLTIEPGQTNLFDAIHSMVKHINAKADSEAKPDVRRILVLITDGDDRKSKIKEKELLAELKQKQIRVYAIGLVQELENEPRFIRGDPKGKAIKFLSKIAKETSGRALFPKNNSAAAGTLLLELFAP